MLRKIILLGIILSTVLFISSVSFASNMGNDIQDSIDKTGNTLGNIVNGTMDAGRNAAGAISNVTAGAVNGVKNTMDNMGNMMSENTTDNLNNNNVSNENNTANDYNATRTATTYSADTGNDTIWIWLVLGVTALIIAGLTWYYMVDNRNHHE